MSVRWAVNLGAKADPDSLRVPHCGCLLRVPHCGCLTAGGALEVPHCECLNAGATAGASLWVPLCGCLLPQLAKHGHLIGMALPAICLCQGRGLQPNRKHTLHHSLQPQSGSSCQTATPAPARSCTISSYAIAKWGPQIGQTGPIPNSMRPPPVLPEASHSLLDGS